MVLDCLHEEVTSLSGLVKIPGLNFGQGCMASPSLCPFPVFLALGLNLSLEAQLACRACLPLAVATWFFFPGSQLI